MEQLHMTKAESGSQDIPEYRKSQLPNSEFSGSGPPDPPSPICTHYHTNKVGGVFMHLCPGGQ